MDKNQKYINYVVDKLVKNTEIDYERHEIKFPFIDKEFRPTKEFIVSYDYLTRLQPSVLFLEYVTTTYGLHIWEVNIVWEDYRMKIMMDMGWNW